MAWLKSIPHPDFGVSVAFWEVLGVNYDHREQKSLPTVGGWNSQADYDAGKIPLMTKSYYIPSGLAPELAAGAVAFVTQYARAQDEFEGSEDVE